MKQSRTLVRARTSLLGSSDWEKVMPYEDALAATRIPKEVAEGVWSKVAMLITEPNAITFAPGVGIEIR